MFGIFLILLVISGTVMLVYIGTVDFEPFIKRLTQSSTKTYQDKQQQDKYLIVYIPTLIILGISIVGCGYYLLATQIN